jgi:hypothetical protein
MLAGAGMAGWHVWRYAGAILFVLGACLLWGLFGTTGDGSRGAPVVETPGQIRLALEITLFGVAAYGYWVVWSRAASETFLTAAVLHYLITWERNWWLLRGAPKPSAGLTE